MTQRNAIILAAGNGTRMKSKLYKVLHQVCGKPMVAHVLDQLEGAEIDNIITVVGYGAETVEEAIGTRAKFVLQKPVTIFRSKPLSERSSIKPNRSG